MRSGNDHLSSLHSRRNVDSSAIRLHGACVHRNEDNGYSGIQERR